MIVFFDIDETLVNQRQAEATAAERFLRVYGSELPHLLSTAEFCRTWRTLRERHAPAFFNGSTSFVEHRRRRIRDLFDQSAIRNAEADARFSVYLEEYRRAWSLFDDVLPCLDQLADHRLGVISNGDSDQQLRKLQHTRIDDRFETIVISDAVGCAKPARHIFDEACRRIRCQPGECVYVGDRLDVDAFGSRAAGMRGIWLNRGDSRDASGVESIESLRDLPSHLKDSPRP